jgi:hypothetical protein
MNRLLANRNNWIIDNYSAMLEISNKQKLCVFSLIRTKKDCYYPPVIADYTPLNNHSKGDSRLNEAPQQIIPTFNLDNQFFTPAFINPY